jgi:hypothetical protein
VRGASVRGLVRDGSGAVLADAEVEVGEWQQLAHWRTLTGADGAFELRGLPAGEIVIAAEHDDAGKASTPLLVPEAGTIACELQLSRGLELRGRVLDDAGAPVPKAMVECMSSRPVGGSWFASFVNTDAEGRFSVANCPEGDTLTVSVRGKEIEELRRTGVDPTAGECELRVRRGQPRSVRIRGTVIAHDGRPVANAWADARRQGTRDSSGMIATDNDGRFELGPVAPGAWRVFVRSSEHPEFTSEPRELAAEAVWDLGRIQLAQGGTALVQVLGERAGVRFQAVDVAETRTWGVDERDGALRTSVLAPGAYRLLVSGGSTAVQAVPFAILAGAETQVGVRLQPGTRQRFELELPATLETGDYVRVRVERGADLIGRASATVQRGEPCATELQLLPGSYVATAIGKELRARAEFTVGAAEAAPVRLSLR